MSKRAPVFRIIDDPRHKGKLAIASDSEAAQIGGGIPMDGLMDDAWLSKQIDRMRIFGTVTDCREAK